MFYFYSSFGIVHLHGRHYNHEVAAVGRTVQEVWRDSCQVFLGEIARREDVKNVTWLRIKEITLLVFSSLANHYFSEVSTN